MWFAVSRINLSCPSVSPFFHFTDTMQLHALHPYRYFEQRLQAAEESYREEIALLQLRLVEGALEESVIKTAGDRYVTRSVWKRILWKCSLN